MNARCFVNQVAAGVGGRTARPPLHFDCHVLPSPRPNVQAAGEARAVHALIDAYISAGLPRAAAVEAAWRDCAHCFANLFPFLTR